MGKVLNNVIWGIKRGIYVSVMLVLYISVLYLVRGKAPFERYHTSLQFVIALYACGGVVTGSIVGLLKPLVRGAVGAAAVGIIAAVPVYTGAMAAYDGAWRLENIDVTGVLIMSVCGGGTAGYLTWRLRRR